MGLLSKVIVLAVGILPRNSVSIGLRTAFATEENELQVSNPYIDKIKLKVTRKHLLFITVDTISLLTPHCHYLMVLSSLHKELPTCISIGGRHGGI